MSYSDVAYMTPLLSDRGYKNLVFQFDAPFFSDLVYCGGRCLSRDHAWRLYIHSRSDAYQTSSHVSCSPQKGNVVFSVPRIIRTPHLSRTLT
jgi:hypothetical protein